MQEKIETPKETIVEYFQQLPKASQELLPFNFSKVKPYPKLNVKSAFETSKAYRSIHRCYNFYKPISKIFK